MNKLGGEKLLSIWWFIVLTLIAVSIFIGVAMYSSTSVNINEIEADILAEKIISCISESGNLKSDIFLSNNNIIEQCNINPALFMKDSYYYLNVSIFNFTNAVYHSSFGDHSFEYDCAVLSKVTANNNYPKCVKRRTNLVYLNKNLNVVILAASNQQGKNSLI